MRNPEFIRAHEAKERLLQAQGVVLVGEELVKAASPDEEFRITVETLEGSVSQLVWCPMTSSFEAVKVQP